MDILIWAGAAVSLLGVGGLIWCVLTAIQARQKGLAEAEMKAVLQRVVTVNMAALGISAIGLAMVVAGILLG